MKKSQDLQNTIRDINAKLRELGKDAIQEIVIQNKPTKYGYKTSCIIDATNEVLGMENWIYDLLQEDTYENQCSALVAVYLKTENGFLCKGPQRGFMQIVKNNVGDAQKGAITAAISKGLSLWSIGQDAYLGKLETVYKSGNPATPNQPGAKSQMPSGAALSTPSESSPQPPQDNNAQTDAQGASSDGLPVIDGVTYEQRKGGVVVALGKPCYDHRGVLKAAGFAWDKAEKVWSKAA